MVHCRDIAQLQPQALQTIDMAHKLASASAALAQAYSSSATATRLMAAIEPVGSVEHRSWATTQALAQVVSPQQRRIALLYQTALYEPLAFFGLNCLKPRLSLSMKWQASLATLLLLKNSVSWPPKVWLLNGPAVGGRKAAYCSNS
jgi:hypothetical protein